MKSFSGSIKSRSSELNLALAADWWNPLQALNHLILTCGAFGRLRQITNSPYISRANHFDVEQFLII
jgi:hypothetical protein